MAIHGYPEDLWNSAKEKARTVLIRVATARGTMAYSDLARQIRSISFLPSDQRFFFLLREISSDEHLAGRGMLTAVVVHKAGDYKPGPGFFELAEMLGLNVSDADRLWIDQLKKVHEFWSARGPAQGKAYPGAPADAT